MKKIISILALTACLMGAKAQNVPQTVRLQVEDLEYKKPSAGVIALNILAAVADPSTIHTADESLLPQIRAAVRAATSDKPWLSIHEGTDGEADYRLTGIIKTAETGSGNPTSCLMVVQARLVDLKTGKDVATKICKGYDFTYGFRDNGAIKVDAAADLTKSVSKFLFEALPITGTVLERGVEQASGKMKMSQCYVDMGSLHGLLPDMKLYIVDNGKYKGELKVVEVMGDDLCSCKIVKGASYISKSLEKGETVAVTTKPKKIKDD